MKNKKNPEKKTKIPKILKKKQISLKIPTILKNPVNPEKSLKSLSTQKILKNLKKSENSKKS